MGKSDCLPVIWEVPDDLWERIQPVITEMDPAKSTGRRRADPRRILDGIIFRMRSGCQWNRLPRELGDDSTIHRTYQRWVELGGVEWEWQAADCAMGKARFGGTQLAATPRTGTRQAASEASWLTLGEGRWA